MLAEYEQRFYNNALKAYRKLTSGDGEEAKKIIDQRQRYQQLWDRISLDHPVTDRDISRLKGGESFQISVDVKLGELQPAEVEVHIYYGPVDSHGNIYESHYEVMKKISDLKSGEHRYRQEISCKQSGHYGFTCRVVPSKIDWRKEMPGFITWA